MGKVKELRKRFNAIAETQEEELEKIIMSHEKEVVALNIGQLMSGVDSEGGLLPEYRSEWYKNLKRTLNPRGVTDLRLSGSFHDNFFIAVALPLTIWSYDGKTDELVKKYGRNTFGLTAENRKVFALGYIKKGFGEFYKRMLRI